MKSKQKFGLNAAVQAGDQSLRGGGGNVAPEAFLQRNFCSVRLTTFKFQLEDNSEKVSIVVILVLSENFPEMNEKKAFMLWLKSW